MTRQAARPLLLLYAALACGSSVSGTSGAETSDSSADRDPSPGVLVRYEVGGGLVHLSGTVLPRWTLYGDGLVVWTEGGEPTPGFASRVMIGHLPDEEIRALLDFIDGAGFWQLEASYSPRPSVNARGHIVRLDPAGAPDQPSGALTVQVGDRTKRVSVYPADWSGAPDAYVSCTERLLQVRATGAREFEPEAYRLGARSIAGTRAKQEASEWPFEELRLPRPSGQLLLSRDQGLAIFSSLGSQPWFVRDNEATFEITLFAEPPRAR